MLGRNPITVITLTYNEEINVRHALESVYGWADEILVVDSYSTDRTLEIAREYTDKIYQHPFEDFAQQRNWALELPITHDWIFYLDADEVVSDDLKRELECIFSNGISHDVDVLAVRHAFFFLGKHLRYAHQGALELRIMRKDRVSWKSRGLEWLYFDGTMLMLETRLKHYNRRSLHMWTADQNKRAGLLADYLYGSREEEGRWESHDFVKRMKYRLYYKLPLFVRPIFHFCYRYFIRLGILDGIPGLIYAFLMYFWFYFLIDAKYYENLRTHKISGSLEEVD